MTSLQEPVAWRYARSLADVCPWLRPLVFCLPLALLVIASVAVIGFNLRHIGRTFMTRSPIDMWEAGSTALAADLAKGHPLYARMNEPDSLEPGLYSPLQPALLGLAFRWTPPNLTLFRVINLAAGGLFIVLFMRAVGAFRSTTSVVCSLALLLAVDRQLTGLWESPRLDAVLLLLAL